MKYLNIVTLWKGCGGRSAGGERGKGGKGGEGGEGLGIDWVRIKYLPIRFQSIKYLSIPP